MRLALGGTAIDILSIVLRRVLLLIAGGIAVGLLGSVALTRSFCRLLYKVKPLDGATYLGVPLLLSPWRSWLGNIPARRAIAVDPVIALRHE